MEVLPTPQFFYGMKTGEEVTVELEPGKTLVDQVSDASASRIRTAHRTVFFELNGQPREVTSRDRSASAKWRPSKQKADPAIPAQMALPLPGVVTECRGRAESDG